MKTKKKTQKSVFCTWGLAFSVWGLYKKKGSAFRVLNFKCRVWFEGFGVVFNRVVVQI
jgi:hypothetical protein